MNCQSHNTHTKQANSAPTGTTSHPSQEEKQSRQPDYLDLNGIYTLGEPRCDDLCIRVAAEQIWNQKCPNCGCDSKDVKPNGTRQQDVLDEPRGFKSVKIQLRRRSYKCKACGKAGLLPLDCIVQRRRMTRRLLDYLENECLLRPFRELAQEVGLSARTVREIFDDRVSAYKSATEITAPRVLGIDGVYIKRKERAILTDIERGVTIDILETVKCEKLAPVLKCLPGREKVEAVVMDMSQGLKSAVEEALPRAVIVIDRYHIQRMANQALDEVRNRLRKQLQHTLGQRTMCKSSLLRKHPNKLTKREKAELKIWFRDKPELRKAYQLKEQFFAIWHKHNKAAAQESYCQWRLSIRPELELEKDFKKLITAMTNWGEYIFNYFDYKHTNAFTESTNRSIKDIQRVARNGSFETVRAKAIYGMNLRHQMAAARQRQAKPRRSRSGKAGGVLMLRKPLPPAWQVSAQMSLF